MKISSVLCALCCLLLSPHPHQRDAQPGRTSPDADWFAVSGEETVRRDRASVGSLIEARREFRIARIAQSASACLGVRVLA